MYRTKRKKLSNLNFCVGLLKGALSAFFLLFININIFAAPSQAAMSQAHKPQKKPYDVTSNRMLTLQQALRNAPPIITPITHYPLPQALQGSVGLTLKQDLVKTSAERLLGTPYAWGGDSPITGFDCSGFSQYVYKKDGIGTIPRTVLAQYKDLTSVKHLKVGDLVFFHINDHYISHVGIYLGKGYFIHAPSAGGFIRIDTLHNPYWQQRYAGARRVQAWQL